ASSAIWRACRRNKAAGAANGSCSMNAWLSVTACRNGKSMMAPMSDTKGLSERIDALEMRLTFQDETIETLNQTITARCKQIAALTRQLTELKERLQDAESNAAGPVNE